MRTRESKCVKQTPVCHRILTPQTLIPMFLSSSRGGAGDLAAAPVCVWRGGEGNGDQGQRVFSLLTPGAGQSRRAEAGGSRDLLLHSLSI